MSGRLGYATASATPATVRPARSSAAATPKVQANSPIRKRCQAGRVGAGAGALSEGSEGSEDIELHRASPVRAHYLENIRAGPSGGGSVPHIRSRLAGAPSAPAVWHPCSSAFDNARRAAQPEFPLATRMLLLALKWNLKFVTP